MITAGIYKAVAVAANAGTTSNGNDQIVVDLDLVDIGEQVRVYLVITANTAKWVWKKLAAAGWDGNNLDTLDGLGSKQCDVSIKYEMWQGANKMRADIMMPRESPGSLAAKYGREAREALDEPFKL